MLGYLRHLYRSIFKKPGVYISACVVYILFAITTYLIPYVWHTNYTDTSHNLTIFVLNIIAIAIFSTIVTVYLFKDGIEDGTELLIASKPISRIQNIGSKILCLFTLIILLGIPLLFVQSFLALQVSYAWSYILGTYIAFILITIFFAGVTIVCSLVFKKIGSTLCTIGISMLFAFITMINILVSTSVNTELSSKNYTITQFKIYDKNNTKVDSYLLLENGLPVSQKTQNNRLNEVYQNALTKTKIPYIYYYDFGTQWLSLLNLDNFFNFDNSFKEFYSIYPYVPRTYDFKFYDLSNFQSLDFTEPPIINPPIPPVTPTPPDSNPANNIDSRVTLPIPDENEHQLSSNKYYVTENSFCQLGYYCDNVIYQYENPNLKYYLVPIFNLTPNNEIDPNNPIKFYIFDKNSIDKNENAEKLISLITDNSNIIPSIYNAYKSFQKKYMINPAWVLLGYSKNFANFYCDYTSLALDTFITFMANDNPNQTFDFYVYNDIPYIDDELVKKTLTVNEILHLQEDSKLEELINDKKYQMNNSDYYLNNSSNRSYLNSLQSILMYNLAPIQELTINYYLHNNTNLNLNLGIKDFLVNEKIGINLLTYSQVGEFNKLLNDALANPDPLTQFITHNKLITLNLPFRLYSSDKLSTLSIATSTNTLNFWGLIICWSFISAIIWYVGTLIYIKKDFR